MPNRIPRMVAVVAAPMLTLVLLGLFTFSGDSAQSAGHPAPPAQSHPEIPFNISPSLVLTAEDRQLEITGDGVCWEESQMFDLRVRIAQSSTNAFAEARSIDVCNTDEGQTWMVETETASRSDFAEGPAMVCAEVVGYARHGIAGEARWCEPVELISLEAAASVTLFRRNCPSPLHLHDDCEPIREPTPPTTFTPQPPTPTPVPPQEPDAPTNLSVDDADTHSIRVRWVDNSTNEAGFTLWFRQQGDDWETVRAWYHDGEVGTSTGEEYEYIHRDLDSNTEYCYRVGAWNEHGSNFSNVQCTQTLSDPPDAADLDIRFVGHDSVGLDVMVHSQTTFMTIYHREQSAQDWTYNFGSGMTVNDPPSRILGWAARNLEPGTAYCLRVVLSNNGVEGPPSNEECIETKNPPPETPRNFRATEVTDTSVTLEWRDVTDRETHYVLQRNQSFGTDDREFEFGPQDGIVTFTDTGLQPDTEYAYVLVVYSEDNYAVTDPILRLQTEPSEGNGEGLAELRFLGSLDLTPTFPEALESFTITWVACNVGDGETGRFTDVAELNEDTSIQRTIDSQAPGECYEESAQHAGLPPGHHEWVVYLDAEDDVQEYSISNRYGFIIPD